VVWIYLAQVSSVRGFCKQGSDLLTTCLAVSLLRRGLCRQVIFFIFYIYKSYEMDAHVEREAHTHL
jgi:hypothetical protein